MSGDEREKERAAVFQELFQEISKDLCAPISNMGTIQECMDLVEVMDGTFDDVWRQQEVTPPYPEARMKHLMDIIGKYLNLFGLNIFFYYY